MDDAERRARRVRARRARRRRRQALGIVTVLVVGGGVTALAWPGTRPAASASRGPSLGPDTAVTSGSGRRASRAGEKRTTRTTKTPVPILTYHVVAAPPAGAPLPELYVAPTVFAAEMAWLADHGYQAVTLYAVYLHWMTGEPLPPKPVVLTFDDGYRSDDVYARPVLARYHWPGVLNLEIANERPSWGLGLVRLRRLIGAGWEVDAHTITHPDLTALDAARLTEEVAGSRAIVRRQLHVPADFFCYPAGRYDAAVEAAVRAAGYLGATTENYGFATPADLFALDRISVKASDGVTGLAAKLAALSPRL